MKGPRHFFMLVATKLDTTIPPMVGFFSNGKNEVGKVNTYVRLSKLCKNS